MFLLYFSVKKKRNWGNQWSSFV